MTDSRTPDEHIAENELICEKLLGWKRITRGTASAWLLPTGLWTYSSRGFTTWAGAGLILEAFTPLGGSVVMYVPHHEHHWSCSPPGGRDVAVMDGDTGPEAIRAAALEYIRSLS